MKEFIEATHADLKAAGRSSDDFRISNFWAWHIKEDAEASIREARRELMLRGWLGEQYFAPFLEPDEVKFMRDHEQDFLNAFRRSTHVIENVRPTPDTIEAYGQSSSLLNVRGNFVPIISVAQALGIDDEPRDPFECVLLVVDSDNG